MKSLFCKAYVCIPCILVLAIAIMMIGCSVHDSIELAIIGGDKLIIAHGDKNISINNKDEIQKIASLLPSELEKIDEASPDKNDYKLLFIYDDDEQLEISVVDKRTIIYNGWKCRTNNSEINVNYIDSFFGM